MYYIEIKKIIFWNVGFLKTAKRKQNPCDGCYVMMTIDWFSQNFGLQLAKRIYDPDQKKLDVKFLTFYVRRKKLVGKLARTDLVLHGRKFVPDIYTVLL